LGEAGGEKLSRKVLILANVGNRDVRYAGDSAEVFSKIERDAARSTGDVLLDHYEDVAGSIELPIIQKGIRYIESLKYKHEEVLGRSQEAPRVELFCTDQEEPHAKDTIRFARIIEKKLPGLFPNSRENKGLRLKDKDPVTINTTRYNPSRYDYMYDFYGEFFAEKETDWEPEEWLCFALTSGGTPAMNAALILHAIQHFGENCVQIYVPDRDEPSELRLGEEMLRAAIERRFNEGLDASQFRAAARTLEASYRADYRVHACRYAEHRLAFDFRRAMDHCRDAIRDSQRETKRFLESHERDTGRLVQGGEDLDNRVLLIEELFYNLEIKYRSGEFVDALARVFRLQEALLGWVVQRETGIKTDEDKPIEEQEACSVPGLWEYILQKYPRGTKINRRSLTEISGYLCNKPQAGLPAGCAEEISRIRKTANRIDALGNLRNRSIIAHSFEGVSEAEIKGIYKGDLIEDLRKGVGEALNKDLSTNPFFELSERLKF
jgi:hypothetical protein